MSKSLDPIAGSHSQPKNTAVHRSPINWCSYILGALIFINSSIFQNSMKKSCTKSLNLYRTQQEESMLSKSKFLYLRESQWTNLLYFNYNTVYSKILSFFSFLCVFLHFFLFVITQSGKYRKKNIFFSYHYSHIKLAYYAYDSIFSEAFS